MRPSPSHHQVSRGQSQQSAASREEPCPWRMFSFCPLSPLIPEPGLFLCARSLCCRLVHHSTGTPRTAKPCVVLCREPQGLERLAQAKAESLYISSTVSECTRGHLSESVREQTPRLWHSLQHPLLRMTGFAQGSPKSHDGSIESQEPPVSTLELDTQVPKDRCHNGSILLPATRLHHTKDSGFSNKGVLCQEVAWLSVFHSSHC